MQCDSVDSCLHSQTTENVIQILSSGRCRFQLYKFHKKKGRKCKDVLDLKQLYPKQPRTLPTDKVKDLQKLLKYVPPVHHDFYMRLVNSTVDNTPHMCEDEWLDGSADETEASHRAENTVQLTSE